MPGAGVGLFPKIAKLLKAPPLGVGYSQFPPPALGAAAGSPAKRVSAKQRNQVGRPIFVSMMVGVISNPQQNGHIYLEVAPGDGTSTQPADGAFVKVGMAACRNNQAAGTGAGTVQAGGPNAGAGGQVCAMVPADAWFRLSSEAIAGYTEPGFATVYNAVYLPL